jgi:hypothetical protein
MAYRKGPKKNEPRKRTKQERLTPFVQKLLETAIACGNHFSTACKAAGVREETFENWLDKGTRGDPKYVAFAKAIEKAEADSEALAVDIIRAAATGLVTSERFMDSDGFTSTKTTEVKDWRAAAWLLEHRFGMRWAAARKLKFSGALSTRQEVIVHDAGDAGDMVEFDDEGNPVIIGDENDYEGPESDEEGEE